jgi:cellulose synthase/poly-beta-1,6-N-acetylglucosamine synthase-like glycosyltransferase
MLIGLLTICLSLVAIGLLLPCLMLLVEVVCSFRWQHSEQLPLALPKDITLAVLIPAHNEAQGISRTLEGLLPYLRSQDTLMVVADNCTDETAAVARTAGATVVERFSTDHRGKGYALDYGLSQLQHNPPDVVILMDADCDSDPNTIALLANHALASQRPVQANYLIEQPPTTSLKGVISAFAIKVKNFVRPLGLEQLGLPCLLTGTGIALPWSIARAVTVASGHIAEDMKWGIDLALAGHPPTFLPNARVTSRLPSQEEAAKVQRTRWEHGHLQIIREYLPQLLARGLGQGRWQLLSLALEVAILPLSLLVMSVMVIAAASLLLALISGRWLPFNLALVTGGLIFTAIILAWYGYGRSDLSLRQLIMVPVYLLWKVPLYLAFLIRPEQRWVRTRRD